MLYAIMFTSVVIAYGLGLYAGAEISFKRGFDKGVDEGRLQILRENIIRIAKE